MPKKPAPIDYTTTSDASLERLAKHAKEERIRAAAKAEIARRAPAANYSAEVDEILLAIAQRHVRSDIETLKERSSDRLDFYDVSVWGLRDALLAAYEAGRASKG